ncbi:MAG TPA: hypothetical protein VIG47_16835, partial [Gemmatimonadaceae bacterium]
YSDEWRKEHGLPTREQELRIPEGLSPRGREAAEIILKRLREFKHDITSGGCTTFYTPEAWKKRGEEYGLGGCLIVVYDGGEVLPHMSLDGYAYPLVEKMDALLQAAGFHKEECTRWYAAIYDDRA